jgi:hypothetical protein
MAKAKSHSGNAIGWAKPQDHVISRLLTAICRVYRLDSGGLSGEKFRCIRLFFAITMVMKMTLAGDSLLKTCPKFAVV